MERVTFEHGGGVYKRRRSDRLLLIEFVDRAGIGDVVCQQADGVLQAIVAVLACKTIVAEAGCAGEARVGDRGVVMEGGIEVKEGLGVGCCLGFGADIEDRKDDDRLLVGMGYFGVSKNGMWGRAGGVAIRRVLACLHPWC